MKTTLISQDQFKMMPWKNGLGTTAEIAIEPAGCDFQNGDFEWRLSSARIDDENKFSQFPGYDRILTVLSGAGLMLNNQELGPFEVFEFEGEESIDCSLIEGSVEDLGLIYKRDHYNAFLQLLNVTSPVHLKLEPGVHFFLSLADVMDVGGVQIEPPDFLRIEEANSVEIKADAYPAPLLRIQISRIKLNS